MAGRHVALTALVDIKSLLSSRGMSPHNRVLILNRFPPHYTIPISAELRLLKARMHRLKAMQSLLHRLTQAVVRLDLTCKQGIATNFRSVKNVQECDPRSLGFIGDVRVPAHAAVPVCKERIEFTPGSTVTMNDVELRVAFWTPARGVDVVTAEIRAEIKCFLERQICEILVPEGYHFALGDEESELVFSCLGEFAELDPCYFGADAWGEFLDFAALRKKVFEGRVGAFAVLHVVEGL
jgi:hypothetical protein